MGALQGSEQKGAGPAEVFTGALWQPWVEQPMWGVGGVLEVQTPGVRCTCGGKGQILVILMGELADVQMKLERA